MAIFNGTLRSNEIFAALYNMIISQQVFADNIAGTGSELASMFRVDGSLYGDTKLFYATNVLKSYDWLNDAEAANLLDIDRPQAPACQSIVLNKFRQIRLTVDNYLSKRAWGTEGSFSSFNSIMLGWIRETKKIYDATLINAFVGTTETNIGKQTVNIAISAEPQNASDTEVEAYNRLKAQTIATEMANLMVDLKDISDEYNDYGYLRSYDLSKFVLIVNSEVDNEITKLDLPTIFHKDGLEFGGIKKIVLPARYFGNVNTSGGTTPATNLTVRALIEKDFGGKHLFPGQLLPGNAQYAANETYTQNSNIAFKICAKDSVPFMSAFEVGTSFFNPRSLTENHYLTWGHNTLEYLKNYPFITGKLVIG